MKYRDNELRKACENELKTLKTRRSSMDPVWRSCQEYIDPWRGQIDEVAEADKSKRPDYKIIDNVGRASLRTMAAGMVSGLTSPARPWKRLATPDPGMMELPNVRSWLHVVDQRMSDLFSRSNLYNVLHTLYGDLGQFGIGSITELEDPKDVIRFYPDTVGRFWVANDYRLMVGRHYFERKYTVQQMYEMFAPKVGNRYDDSNLSEHVKGLWIGGQRQELIDVVVAIKPTDGYKIPGKLEQFPFMSIWYEKAGEEDKILRMSGYNEFPKFVPRWDVNGEYEYGYSPGMMALGDIKALQMNQKRKAQAIDKQVNPPMVAHPSLQSKRTSALPGDVTYVASGGAGQVGFQPAYTVKPDLQYMLLDNQELRDRIRHAFFADLFLMLANDPAQNRTAHEISVRHEEKLLMLGPVLERLNNELLDPTIERTFGIMMRKGMIPDPPEELQGVNLKVEYISVLSQAQKQVGISAVDRMTGFAMQLAQFDPNVMDKLDTDQALDEYGQMLGVTPAIIRDDEQTAAIRQQRQAQQAAAMQAQQAAKDAQSVASAAKTLSETEADQGALGELREAVNG